MEYFFFRGELPDAHAEAASSAFFYAWNRREAERRWATALGLRSEVQSELLAAYALQKWAVGDAQAALELARAARQVDPLNADATVRRLKGSLRPIGPARQRAELLAGLACVDWVVIFPEPTPRALIAALSPDVYAKGGGWPLATLRAKHAPPGFRGEIRRLRQVPGVRSSAIVDRIRSARRR